MFIPRDALERMLEGTPLVFKEDLETGAIAVTRSEISAADQSTEPQNREETEMTAKKSNLFKTLATALTLVIASGQGVLSVLSAQEQEVGSEVVELEEYRVFTSGQVSALESKRASNIIGSFLDAAAIGALPDDTLGEALSRLAGVNVVRRWLMFPSAGFRAHTTPSILTAYRCRVAEIQASIA